ncbi:protein-disulfide reductase DsbD family protein [Methylocapsa polymorpha]|uniref:Protein-disulfide reductase DsbD family protein n=1 Tax=Methylocapsa polymorpha TaxID=3080828 RepID=A0ABZ0HNY1_9HYPH|nr:protein-disulfide reductase DsbD family protein [Methylocapsa sp. RX1]
MQISFQLTRAAKIRGAALGAAGLASLALAVDARADPYATAWASAQKSAMRLIASAAGEPRGFYRAGAEIRLDPGALTYWRTPGGAGAPPVFSFDGSENVAGVTVLYPAPTRIDESGTEVFGYFGEVTFPFHVTPKDDARPAILALTLRYAVCERLCLPAKAEARLSLPPLQSAGSDARLRAAVAEADGPEAAIAAAEAKAPVRLSATERDAKVAIERIAGAPSPSWRLATLSGDLQDLFAEAPEGWYFETRKSDRPNEFLIVEVERPKAESADAVPVTLTLTEARQSYEFAVELGGPSSRP